jgi:hypothetical protein
VARILRQVSPETAVSSLGDHPAAERALEWIGNLHEIDRSADGGLGRLADLRRGPAPRFLLSSRARLPWQFVVRILTNGNAPAYT